MSNSFYHKDLTEAQWNRIKIVFEEKPKVGRPPLNPRTVFTPSCGYSKAERVGAIYLPVTVIGTAFITSFENGVPSVCLSE